MPDRPTPKRADEDGFVRTTISVPFNLKRQMDRMAANWSAVASEAFERHLERQSRMEAPMSEEEAIQRLRQLKEAGAREADSAFATGRYWAMTDAHPAELERLERHFAQHFEPLGKLAGDATREGIMHNVKAIASAVLDTDDQNRLKHFWQERSGLSLAARPTQRDLYAFCRGAAEFWRSVRDKL